MVRQPELFPEKKYCIDTSSLINLRHYRRDVFPTLWKRLENMVRMDELISHIEVYEEIKVGQDEIYKWCKGNKKMFKDIDDCQRRKFQDVKKYYDKNYWETESMKPRWADPWIVALSICEEAIIVADEKNEPNKIPFIAGKFGIKCLSLLDFFKEIGIKY